MRHEQLYIEYLIGGRFFPEYRSQKVDRIDPSLADPVPGDYAFSFKRRSWRIAKTENGEEFEVDTHWDTVSGMYYIDGVVHTLDEVKALEAETGDHSMLVSNMEGNDWDKVVCCNLGNWQPFEEGDQIWKKV